MARTMIIYADGFHPYPSAAEEISAIRREGFRKWFPRTLDFRATAFYTPGVTPYPVNRAKHFFGALTKVKYHKRIIFIGHGSNGSIGLSGSAGGFDHQISEDELNAFSLRIAQFVQPKLKGATLDLVACNAGVGKTFPQKMATLLGVTVRAFNGPVTWEVSEDGNKITGRGLICLSKDCKGRKIKGAHRLQFKKSETFFP